MIQIDMQMPKTCEECDFEIFNGSTDECLFVYNGYTDKIRTCKRLDACPLHEADPDTVSRKAVLDAVKKCHAQCCRQDSTGDEWVHYDTISNEMECLPPSPSRLHDISKAKFSCPICGAEMEVTVDEWDEGGAV